MPCRHIFAVLLNTGWASQWSREQLKRVVRGMTHARWQLKDDRHSGSVQCSQADMGESASEAVEWPMNPTELDDDLLEELIVTNMDKIVTANEGTWDEDVIQACRTNNSKSRKKAEF